MEKVLRLKIDGNKVKDIPSFYEVLNDLVMKEEDWKLGQSLDAFDDMLYGGYGILAGYDVLELEWSNMEVSREKLGVATTLKYYQDKLGSDLPHNKEYFRQKLEVLKRGEGQTYFDIILEIIQEHKNVILLEVVKK